MALKLVVIAVQWKVHNSSVYFLNFNTIFIRYSAYTKSLSGLAKFSFAMLHNATLGSATKSHKDEFFKRYYSFNIPRRDSFKEPLSSSHQDYPSVYFFVVSILVQFI